MKIKTKNKIVSDNFIMQTTSPNIVLIFALSLLTRSKIIDLDNSKYVDETWQKKLENRRSENIL